MMGGNRRRHRSVMIYLEGTSAAEAARRLGHSDSRSSQIRGHAIAQFMNTEATRDLLSVA
jgi:DNA-directed RNA polymerase specialized sigma subunit